MIRRSPAVWIGAGTVLLLLLAGWRYKDYRSPLPARSHEFNKGRAWEFKTRVDGKGVEQVWVPPGCFEMGSNAWTEIGARANETPRHTVCISFGFWIDRFEVTNESFLQFVREVGYQDRR